MRLPSLSALMAALSLCGLVRAEPVELATLEGWAIEAAPEVRLARAELDIEQRRLDAASARLSPRLFGSTGLSANREATGEDSSYSATRLAAQAGVRWPLAGNQAARQRERRELEATAVRAQLQVEKVRREVLRQLRASYAEYVAARQQARLAAAYLSWQDSVMPVLEERTQAGLLLEADRRGYEVAFTSARTTHERNLLRARIARRTLERLSGHALPELADSVPQVPLQCLQAEVLHQAGDARPEIASASTEVQLRREQLDRRELEGIDAGVTLAQNLSRDFGGKTGWSTSVGVDISVPLEWKQQLDAEAARRRAELSLAEERMGVRLADDQRQIGLVVETAALRRHESLSAADRLDSAFEVWRVARVQAERIAGDPLERALQARLTLYHAGVELSEMELRRWLAELDGPALAPDCAAASPVAPDATTPALADIDGITPGFERVVEELARARRRPGAGAPQAGGSAGLQLTPPQSGKQIAAASRLGVGPLTAGSGTAAEALTLDALQQHARAPAALSAAICPAGSDAAGSSADAVRLDWFVWDSQALLQAPQQLAQLPTSTRRLWLSFSPAQISALDQPAAVGDIRRFIDAARACSLQVELLFGDPDAVRPSERSRIIATLNRLLALGFSGLALDLEREQLAAVDRDAWAGWTLELLRAWRTTSALPLALVTHHRELADAQFITRLQNAGVTELVPMVYIADTAAAMQQTAVVLEAAGALPVTVAQSIEAALPASESLHGLGRSAALARWQALARALPARAGLRAIAVQSLEDYLRSTP